MVYNAMAMATRLRFFFVASQQTILRGSGLRWYSKNPLEGRSFETLMGES